MKRHQDAAERIIKLEGLAFALAASVGKGDELGEARAMLKDAIVRELRNAFADGAALCRRSMEGNALMDEIEAAIQR